MRKLSVIFCVIALLLFVMPIAASSNATNFDEGQSISALSVLSHSIEDAGSWLMDVRQDIFDTAHVAISPGHPQAVQVDERLSQIWQYLQSMLNNYAR